jgi:hypothetical protein
MICQFIFQLNLPLKFSNTHQMVPSFILCKKKAYTQAFLLYKMQPKKFNKAKWHNMK